MSCYSSRSTDHRNLFFFLQSGRVVHPELKLCKFMLLHCVKCLLKLFGLLLFAENHISFISVSPLRQVAKSSFTSKVCKQIPNWEHYIFYATKDKTYSTKQSELTVCFSSNYFTDRMTSKVGNVLMVLITSVRPGPSFKVFSKSWQIWI